MLGLGGPYKTSKATGTAWETDNINESDRSPSLTTILYWHDWTQKVSQSLQTISTVYTKLFHAYPHCIAISWSSTSLLSFRSWKWLKRSPRNTTTLNFDNADIRLALTKRTVHSLHRRVWQSIRVGLIAGTALNIDEGYVVLPKIFVQCWTCIRCKE